MWCEKFPQRDGCTSQELLQEVLMEDRRQYERIEAPLEIKVTWPGKGTRLTTTLNFSDGGALVQNVFDEAPPVDTEVFLQLNAPVLGMEAPILAARVVRGTDTEIACQFIVPDREPAEPS
jgi:c-di-GMP-binding flagellar brake protein YcgR